jgi:CheY-like chemotaxis protein
MVNILLVEDDPAHAEIAQRNLASLPVASHVTHAADGQAALDLLGAGARPDLILLDLRLPKVDGLEVLRRVKSDPALRTIPVIVLTTSDAPGDLDAAYAAGANSYLVKPVVFDNLLRLMDSFGRYWLEWNRGPQPHA